MKLKNLFVTLGLALAVGVGVGAGVVAAHAEPVKSVDAATETTVYCAISEAKLGSYTLKLNTNQQTNPDSWQSYVMTDTGTTLDSKKVFSATYTDLWDGVAAMQFQLYDGDTWIEQTVAYSSWTAASNYNGKTWIYDDASWNVAKISATLQVTFSADVPDYVDIYLSGDFNSWSDDVSVTKMTRSSNTVFTYALSECAVGTYGYKVVACYSGATVMDWNHQITTSDQSLTLEADDDGTVVALGDTKSYDFATNMPQEVVADGAVVQLTFTNAVPANVNIIYVGGLTNWGTSAERLAAGLMSGDEDRLVFTWTIPANTYTGSYEYKIVAMSANSGATTVDYSWLVYGTLANNETLVIDTTTTVYALNALDNDLSELSMISFAEGFVAAMATPCSDATADNSTAVAAIWATWKANFEALSTNTKAFFGTSSDETVVQAKALYLHCVARYSLDAWTDAPASIGALSTPTDNSVIMTSVIIAVAVTSTIALAVLIVIKKRKSYN